MIKKTPKIAVYIRANKPERFDGDKYYRMIIKDINNYFNRTDLDAEKIVGFDELIFCIKEQQYEAIYAKGRERFTRDVAQLRLLEKTAIKNNVKLYDTTNFTDFTSPIYRNFLH